MPQTQNIIEYLTVGIFSYNIFGGFRPRGILSSAIMSCIPDSSGTKHVSTVLEI